MDNLCKDIKFFITTPEIVSKKRNLDEEFKRKQSSDLTMNMIIQGGTALEAKPQNKIFINESSGTIIRREEKNSQNRELRRSASLSVETQSTPRSKQSNSASPNTATSAYSNAISSSSNITNGNIFSSQLTREPETYEEHINNLAEEWASVLLDGSNYPTSSDQEIFDQENDTTNLCCCSSNSKIITELYTSSTSYHAPAWHDTNRMCAHNELNETPRKLEKIFRFKRQSPFNNNLENSCYPDVKKVSF
ncbi:31605_t:CDS:2, partial [Racocetra persica]